MKETPKLGTRSTAAPSFKPNITRLLICLFRPCLGKAFGFDSSQRASKEDGSAKKERKSVLLLWFGVALLQAPSSLRRPAMTVGRASAARCEKRHLFLSFPYVCPEPVLAK
jgi:hypothetical protein